MGCFSASIWLFLVMMAAITLLVHAQPSQAGFISIDCGIASNSSYVDEVTNITYISDDQYIDTGSISKIDSNYEDYAYLQQFLNVRSFPTGERNCYTVPVVQYQRYLVRVMFMYGNYDGNNRANSVKPLQFELHLGVNLWDKINITSPSQFVELEALTLAAANFTSICLINTRNGDPFISAIELRPLKDAMYNFSYSNSDLNRIVRYNFGVPADEQLRYPDDPFDRLWDGPPESAITTNVMIISTNQSVNNRDYYIEAPPAVLQTAITPTNATVLTFEFDSDSVDDQLYDMLYFAELEILTRNTTRTFDIYGDHMLYYSNFTPLYLLSNESYRSAPMSGSTRYKYSLNATSDSTLPPIINAFEVYAVILLTGIPTHLNDVYAMNAIKKQYLVKKNWMGDPCSPSQYIWDGLQCAYGSNTSRITSLDLSSSGLVGAISSSFAELTSLTHLDLSKNNLTGAIPDALGNMQLLKDLILSCNNLTGPLPDSLRQRSNDGQVVVRYDNTACGRNSSKGKISKLVIVVISVVSAVLLLLVVFIAWRVRKVQDRGDRLQQKPEQVDYQIKPELKHFNYKELSYVTRNFESVIGEGGFGTVYRGTLHDGKQVAVKMLSLTSTQGLKEFFAEKYGTDTRFRRIPGAYNTS